VRALPSTTICATPASSINYPPIALLSIRGASPINSTATIGVVMLARK
jgi:hypothetical protein